MNLIYFCPLSSQVSGGVKVIYRHVNLINQLALPNVSAQVYHWEQPSTSSDWYGGYVPLKTDSSFDASNDFAILPECHLYDIWRRLGELGVRYSIFVQNGYLLGVNIAASEIEAAYHGASFIQSISEDTSECIKMLIPSVSNKILPMSYSIQSDLFSDNDEKDNLITYMPRKLPEHSSRVRLFLERSLPPHWDILPIDALPESEVAKILRRSKIFMSFSSFEGLPIPPVEAAFCGNLVIGYTGQGAKEYWDPLLFKEIQTGDIRSFVNTVLMNVEKIDIQSRLGINPVTDDIRVSRAKLRNRFSVEHETHLLMNFIDKTREAMAPVNSKKHTHEPG